MTREIKKLTQQQIEVRIDSVQCKLTDIISDYMDKKNYSIDDKCLILSNAIVRLLVLFASGVINDEHHGERLRMIDGMAAIAKENLNILRDTITEYKQSIKKMH